MKTGLVLEGGAMRGMFTAGVLDVLMEHGLTTDGTIGVSAGAVFGCNFKSHQIGRVIRYNTEYCNDKRYASFRNLLRTGNLYSEDFCYHEVPEKLDPFDEEAFRASPMDFFVVCTDLRTGDPIYHKCRSGDAEDVRWMEASASMPLAAKAVRIGHYSLLDGGVADSIPVRFFESLGYKRNLIILTQPKGFVKKKNPMLPAIRARYLRYPAFVAAVADRHERYNEALSYIAMQEASGKDYVIRPPIPLEIGAMERDPAQLRRVNNLIFRKIGQFSRTNGVEAVTPMHGWIMEYLYRHSETPVFQRDIEREFSITRSTVTNILQLMERKGYITRRSVEQDARLKQLVLTEKGRQFHENTMLALHQTDEYVASLLTEEENTELLRLLNKLYLGLK